MTRTRKLKKVTFRAKGKVISFKAKQMAKKGAKSAYKHGRAAAKQAAKQAYAGGKSATKQTIQFGKQQYKERQANKKLQRVGTVVKCPMCSKKFIAPNVSVGNAMVRRHVNEVHFK